MQPRGIDSYLNEIPPRYRLRRFLGQGGEGFVFLVEDLRRGQARLALKAAVNLSSDPSSLGRLSDEFLTLSRLAHPSLARVRDLGYFSGGGGAFFTADFVAGANLLEWIAATSPGVGDLHAVAAQALSVLSYLHRKGLLHGDVKPSNLMVETSPLAGNGGPRLRLIDFGSAHLRSGLGQRYGTRAYLPPLDEVLPGTASRPGNGFPGGARDPDLYGLGLTLFHALVGHLPFAVDDPAEQIAWWKRREPATPSRWSEDVSRPLDVLVRCLTDPSPGERFQDAGEALEFLRASVDLPPSTYAPALEGVGFYGRDELLIATLEMIDRLGRGVVIVAGAPQSGKSSFLEMLERNLQAAGEHVVHQRAAADERSAREAFCAVEEILGSEPRGRYGAVDVVEALSRLDRRLVWIVDDVGLGPSSPVLREVVRCAADATSRRRPLIVVLATSRPDAALAELELSATEVETVRVQPLEREALREMASDFFAVGEVPERVLDVVEDSSDGMASVAREVLQLLGSMGVAADSLGELRTPAELPRRLSPAAANLKQQALGRVPAPRLRQLALLSLSRTSLRADEMASLFPQFDAREWRRGLDQLNGMGCLRRVVITGEERFSASLSLESSDLLGRERDGLLQHVAGPRGKTWRARLLRLCRRQGRGRPHSPEMLAAAVRWLLAAGLQAEAARLALRLRRLWVRRSREEEALDLMTEVVGSEKAPAHQAVLLVRLRAAALAWQLGRDEDGSRLLAGIPAGAPAWFRQSARFQRALIHQSQGKLEEAVRELEHVRRVEQRRRPSRGGRPGLFRFDIEARLARLHFQRGEGRKGARALEWGQKLSQRVESDRGAASARAARILAMYASSEVTHGNGPRARDLLERALDLARRLEQEEILKEPLGELAVLHAGNNRLAEAYRLFGELQKLAERTGDRVGQLQALYNQANTCYQQNRMERAEDLYRRACRLSDQMGRHALSATVWIGLAAALRERGRTLEAIRLYRRVLRPSPLVRKNDQILACNNLGEIYLSLGRLEKSRRVRQRALDIAEELANHYLLALALRGVGAACWALGRVDEARRAFERALDIDARAAAPRHAAPCHYYLGCIAAAGGGTEEAIRFFRRALVTSRRTGERAYREASTLAILETLVRRDRRGAARRIVDSMLHSGGPLPLRSRLVAGALAARVAPRWPNDPGALLKILEAGERDTQLWQTFLALTDALHDPRLPPDLASSLRGRQQVLCLRLSRWIAAADRESFRRFWLREDAAPARPGTPRPHAERGDRGPAGRALDPEWTAAALAALRTRPFRLGDAVEAVLGSLVSTLPARGAWTVNTSADPAPFFGAPGAPEAPLHLLERGGQMLETPGPREGVRFDGDALLMAVGDEASSRYLYAEAEPGAWTQENRPRLAACVEEAVAILELLFRLAARERELERERGGHADTRKELKKLTALVSRDKGRLETAVLTRRLARVEAARHGEAGSEDETAPVAGSAAMKAILSRLSRTAESGLPLLLLGESGVGKDRLARWVHSLSRRRDGPFVPGVCSLPDSLLESELFGSVRGAFTDAVADRPGLFQQVAGGTLYLDEVADLSPSLQSRLLRVLETHRVRPVGAEREISVDFGLISSSRATSVEDLKQRGLREELFFRLHGEVVTVPPLRERPDDIPVLLDHLLARYTKATGHPRPPVHPEAVSRLKAHGWPGNVRELENEVQRLLVESPREIGPENLFREAQPGAPPLLESAVAGQSFRQARDDFERRLVLSTLRLHGGNATQAARKLEITRRYLGKLLEKHGIDLDRLKGD